MCNAPGDNEVIATAAEVAAEAARTKAAADIKAKEAELAPAEVTAQEKKAEAAKNSEGDSAGKPQSFHFNHAVLPARQLLT